MDPELQQLIDKALRILDGYQEQLKLLLQISQVTGKEASIAFCQSMQPPLKIRPSNYSIGAEFMVIPPYCRINEKKIGGVHTHPGDLIFSPDNAAYACEEELEFHCIARPKHRELGCWVYNTKSPHYPECKEAFLKFLDKYAPVADQVYSYMLKRQTPPPQLTAQLRQLGLEFKGIFEACAQKQVITWFGKKIQE